MQVLQVLARLASDQYLRLKCREGEGEGAWGNTHISVKPFEFHFQEALQMDLILAKILEQLLARANWRCIDDLVELLANNHPTTVAVQAERLN
jgi:hypothetical protein